MGKQKPLRILLISSQYPPYIGGGGSHTFYLASELSRRQNVEVHVLTEKVVDKPDFEKIQNRQLTIHRAKFEHSAALHYEAAIRRGQDICNKINPDVIHGQHIPGSLVGLHLKAAFRKPLIVTLHKTPVTKWDSSLIQQEPLYSYIKLLSSSDVDSFVAGSRSFKQELLRFGITRDRVELIYHGIPIRWYQSTAYNPRRQQRVKESIGWKEGDKLILCSSRLDEERKEIDVFIKAGAQLQKAIASKQFTFLVTGHAANASELKYQKSLLSLAHDSGIGDSVKFLPKPLEFADMPALYGLAKVCVLPSITEGLGLVLLEALAVRTPVIGTTTNGITDIIKTNGRHGLRFQIGKYTELATQLQRLFSDIELEKLLKREGYKRVKKNFDSPRMADECLQLYRKLLGRKKKNG